MINLSKKRMHIKVYSVARTQITNKKKKNIQKTNHLG